MRPKYEEQFRGWTVHLTPAAWRGITFLDGGCGMGRNSYWPTRYGAAGGMAIDVEDAAGLSYLTSPFVRGLLVAERPRLKQSRRCRRPLRTWLAPRR
jgi:hypothetical protein